MGGMHVAEQWIIQDFLMPIDKLADTVKFRHQQCLEKTTGNIVFVLAERFLHYFNIQVHMILVNLARIKSQEIIFFILLAVTFDTFPVIQETMLYLHFTSVFFKDFIHRTDRRPKSNQPTKKSCQLLAIFAFYWYLDSLLGGEMYRLPPSIPLCVCLILQGVEILE